VWFEEKINFKEQDILMNTDKKVRRHIFIFNLFLRFLTSGLKKQNFIGSFLIAILLKFTPQKHRIKLALRLVAISPHYFIYQYTSKYPSGIPYKKVCESEHQRITKSRHQICEQILNRWLQPKMHVLDFGCGAGHLIYAVAQCVESAIGVDISSGIIACAKVICQRDNMQYFAASGKLAMFRDLSFDLIYSFAVIQHLDEATFEEFLKVSYRLLKPGGILLCHIPIKDGSLVLHQQSNDGFIPKAIIKDRLRFDMIYRESKSVELQILGAGFQCVEVLPIREIFSADPDISKQHLFIAKKI
jgi:SAM-dependent methyltransferase